MSLALAMILVVLGVEGRAHQEQSVPGVSNPDHEPAAARPAGLHACPVETMSCYPGCAQVGELYACGAQLIVLAGGLTAALIAVAESEDTSVDDFCKKHTALCAKGGVQNKENEYVRDARLRADPCGWLQEQYAGADASEREKIRLAQKFLGCRNKQKRKT
ncbi:hypothetical protein [Archangium gephyra]|nr:hypothetical protein [Archangium gephyra]